MPRLRSPSGAPVPVGAPPTSRITADGAMKSTSLPAVDIAGEPAEPWPASAAAPGRLIQRVVRTPRGVRSVAAGVSATPISPSVLGWTKGRCERSSKLSISKLVIAPDMEIGRLGPPVRVVEPVEIGDVGGVHAVGVAHPDPDEPVALDQRIGGDARAGWDRRSGRGTATPIARAVKLEPVIAALDPVAQDAAHRERERAVTAPVLQRGRGAVGGPVEQDGRAQDLPGKGPAGLHLVLPRGGRTKRFG